MRLSTAVALALTLLLAVLTAGSVIVAPAMAAAPAADGSPASVQSTAPALESSVQDGDEYVPERADPWQVIRLNVTETGDVRWTLESRFNLSANETEEFREYADSITNDDRDAGYDIERFETARINANQSTDREMAFENETWTDPRNESLDNEGGDGTNRELGVISYSFTWTNFTDVDDGVIDFGDAFVTDDGVWFSRLEDGQRLVIESPPNSRIDNASAPAKVQNGAVIYDGYMRLSERDFQIDFERLDTSSPNPNPDPDPDPSPDPEPPSESEPFLTAERVAAAFGGFVLFIVAVSLVISRYQRSAWPFDGSSAGAEHPRATETDGSGTAPVASTPDPSGIEHEFDETEAVDTGPDADTDETIDDLLSDDERVQRLLERNGGRMKQATIVKETGWSDAKVSQLLSEMDDDDRIQKLRIGRENLITLPDVDPTELD